MDLKIYTGYDKYFPRGTVTISYDRISHINLYIPRSFAVLWTIEREAHYRWCEEKGEIFKTHHIYKDETDYKFTIKKLSKAEIPYRKGGMTHQILSNDLMNRIDVSHLYTKLKWPQVIKIRYNSNRFVWQTKEFKKHIYFHIGTNIASAILGILGTLLVVRGCGKGKDQSDNRSTPTTSDSTQKANRLPTVNKSGDVDSTVQYPVMKNEDSLTKTNQDTATATTQ